MKSFLKIGLSIALMLAGSSSYASDGNLSFLSDDQIALHMAVQMHKAKNIGIELAKTRQENELRLQERQLQRDLAQAQMRINAIETMGTQKGDIYSINKEFLFTKADFLLYGCMFVRIADY